MKDCILFLAGIDTHCGKLPEDKCLLLDNEGYDDGYLEGLHKSFQQIPTEYLQKTLSAHKPGGQYGDRCKISPEICTTTETVLKEREP